MMRKSIRIVTYNAYNCQYVAVLYGNLISVSRSSSCDSKASQTIVISLGKKSATDNRKNPNVKVIVIYSSTRFHLLFPKVKAATSCHALIKSYLKHLSWSFESEIDKRHRSQYSDQMLSTFS